MKKFFLIPLMACLMCVSAWAGNVALITNADQLRAFLTEEGTAIGATNGEFSMADQSAITVVGTKTLTVSHNITNCNTSGLFVVNGSLTILGTGSISCINGKGEYLFDVYGTMEVGNNTNGPSITAAYPIYMNYATTKVTLNNGSLNATNSVNRSVFVKGTFTMNGGTISNTTAGSIGLQVFSGTATINGGEISAPYMAIANSGTLTINGGEISATGTTGYVYGVYNEGAVTMINGEISASNGPEDKSYGIALMKNGASVEVQGGAMTANAFGITGNGNISNTLITISGGNITGTYYAGIYHPQAGNLNISGGTISGASGIYAKSGTINITGGTISGTGDAVAYNYNGNGANSTGDAIVVDACNYPGGAPSVTISNGTFTSAHADAVGNYTYGDSEEATGNISGGTYSSEVPAELCEAGKGPKNNGNGTYTVKAYDYSRTVTAGNFGTICLNKAGKFYGGTLYNIVDKGDNSIVLEEAGEEMVAGQPYIFKSNAATVYAMFSSEETANAGNANGLHGVYSETAASEGWCVVYNNQYWYVNSNNVKVGANCAYFVLSEINAQANVPGRRRITMSANGANTATGVDNVENAAQSTKMIENGQVIILRNGQKYNVAGQIVK